MATGGTDNSKHTGAHQLFIDRVPGRQLFDFTLIFAPHLRLVTTASIFGSAGHASRFLTIQTPHQLDIETPRATPQFFEPPVMSNNLCAEVLSTPGIHIFAKSPGLLSSDICGIDGKGGVT
ncbi:hypothetical protein B0H13DRAFT_1863839 [Mycena leptocephala]|nr:hypothetical protein B0H13DRAFT_1863839 [Mycena leptocephala]